MTMKASLTHFALGVSMMVGMTAGAVAQTATKGEIRGTVTDASGAMVPRAQIVISNAAGFSRKLKSGAKGSFEVPQLAPGFYSVSINALGFSPALEGIRVAADKVSREDVTLGISLEQAVEVKADDVVDAQEDGADAVVGNR
jgi:Carboxypeptidase regulatory-like domain